ERMWFDRQIVHVRDPLRRRLRVMTADAVLRVELRSYRLLVAQCDLVKIQFDGFSRRISREPISSPPLDATIAVPVAVACRGTACLLLREHPAISSVTAQTAMSTCFISSSPPVRRQT